MSISEFDRHRIIGAQIYPPRHETIKGRRYYNTGRIDYVERVSYYRVIIAGAITGSLMFGLTRESRLVVKITATAIGIIGGMHLGKECTVKEVGIKREKILTKEERREQRLQEHLEEERKKRGFSTKPQNIFKWIWPS